MIFIVKHHSMICIMKCGVIRTLIIFLTGPRYAFDRFAISIFLA